MANIFILLTFAIAPFYVQNVNTLDIPSAADCMAKTGVTEANLTARPRQDSPEIRCFWKCILECEGAIDADGNVVPENLGKGYPKASTSLDPKMFTDLKACYKAIGKITSCDDVDKVKDCFEKIVRGS